jgi:hypothetical protein
MEEQSDIEQCARRLDTPTNAATIVETATNDEPLVANAQPFEPNAEPNERGRYVGSHIQQWWVRFGQRCARHAPNANATNAEWHVRSFASEHEWGGCAEATAAGQRALFVYGRAATGAFEHDARSESVLECAEQLFGE